MKKRLILLALLFPVVLHAQLIDRLTVNPGEIGFEKQDGFDRIRYGTEYLQEPGDPELPVVSRSFVIPTGAEVSGIEVEITNERKLEGSYYLYPVQPPQIVGESTNGFVKPNRTYLSATVFPDNAAFLSFDGMVQGYHVITVSYYPVGYLPQARELYLRDLSVTVNYQPGGNTIEQAKSPYNRAMLSKAFVKSMVQNPADVELYYNESAVVPPTTVMDRFSGSSLERSLNAIGEMVPDYVIITCDSLIDSYKRLAEWKTKKGVPTVIKSVEEIKESYSGSDLVEKIRNYLIDVKNRWNGNGLFVLLGGDVEIIPTRMVSGYYYSLYPADCYYVASSVKGWNPVNSKFDSSYKPSSFLGRLPLQTIRETDIFIEKLLSYEKANTDGVDYSYFNNSLIVNGFNKVNREQGVNKDITLYTTGQMDSLYNYCQNRNRDHNYWYLFDHAGCTDPKHTHEGSGSYNTSQVEELTKSSFISAWRNGKSFGKFHFIYHLDHSMQANMGTSSSDKGDHITNEDVDNIPDDRYPKVILSAGCHPARFEKDCIAEHFLKKTYGGAVAFIGNTDVGHFYESVQLKSFLDEVFSENKLSTYQFSIGYLYGRILYFPQRYSNNYRLHLLGDPEMPVWTSTPKQLQIATSTQAIGSGKYNITVQVVNLPAGQQALICLMKGEEGYATLAVSDTKPHNFTFTPLTSGTVSLTVTAHNFKPHESTIPVQTNNNTAVYVSGYTFLDGTTSDSAGNGDGKLDAGETVELNVKLKNRGMSAVEISSANLYCNRPELITILNNRAPFGYISPGGELSCTENFRIKINEDIGGIEVLKNDFKNVCFIVKAYKGTVLYIDSFKVDLFAGQPELLGQTFRPDASISGKYQMYINVTNTGKSTLTGLKGVLVPDEGGSFVGSCPYDTSVFPDIPPGEMRQNTFLYTFVVKAGYTTGNPLKMKLKLTNAYGKTWELPLDPVDTPAKVDVKGITVQSNGYGVRLCWQKTNKAVTYNVYSCYADIPATYTKLNGRPLSSNYFQDESYQPLQTYYYKVEAVSASGNVGEKSEAVKVTTHPELVANFPQTTTQRCSAGGIEVEDVDNDGYKEIVVTGSTIGETKRGFLSILNYKGQELFHKSGNPMDGVGEMVTSVTSCPSVGNLLGDGSRQIVTTTWNDGSTENAVDCFAAEDRDNNGQADRLWQNIVKYTMYRGAVLANLDNSDDGSMETLVRSNSGGTKLIVLDNKGRLKKEIGKADRYSRPAVADLDGDGDLEIIACYDNVEGEAGALKGGGMYIWHHDGTPYGKSPFWGDGIRLCSPVICTLNGEKVAFVAETLALNSRIFAVWLSGNSAGKMVSGLWGDGVRIPYSNASASGLDHMLSVGDINGDGEVEVVALGVNRIKAWDISGKELFSATEPQLFSYDAWSVNIQAPILADVDGDGIADIIYTAYDRICAIKGDGSKVPGFPFYTNMPVHRQVCVADIDYDGKNELIAMDSDAQIFMWKTQGKATGIEWGSERHDPRSTGEYGPVCESKIIKFNTTSNGITPCGNIIIRSGGKYTIPSGVSLALNLHSMIVVRDGAELEINGGTLTNANILAVPGSRIVLKNGGKIQLRDGGKMRIENGATFSNQGGRIETIY